MSDDKLIAALRQWAKRGKAPEFPYDNLSFTLSVAADTIECRQDLEHPHRSRQMIPDQHFPLSVGDKDREAVRAHIRKAIRELQAIEASLPPVLIDGMSRQRGTAHNYLTNVVPKIAEAAFDCTLNVAEIAASLGNDDSFDRKGVRAAMLDVLNDELADARQWADGEMEDA